MTVPQEQLDDRIRRALDEAARQHTPGPTGLAAILAEDRDAMRCSADWNRRRSRLVARVLSPAIALAAVLAVVVFVIDGTDPSILARAMAAISARDAIIHFSALSRTTDAGGTVIQSAEVWLYQKRTHAIEDERMTFSPEDRVRFSTEVAVDGDRVETYAAGAILRSHAAGEACASKFTLTFVCGTRNASDPLEVVRGLYQAGLLHSAGETLFKGRMADVIVGSVVERGVRTAVRVLVEPKTFAPLEIVRSSRSGKQTTTIQNYQRLPATAGNVRLLALRPHPSAQVLDAPCGWGAALGPRGLQNLTVEPCKTGRGGPKGSR